MLYSMCFSTSQILFQILNNVRFPNVQSLFVIGCDIKVNLKSGLTLKQPRLCLTFQNPEQVSVFSGEYYFQKQAFVPAQNLSDLFDVAI